jgi:hypothetical protein
MCVSLGSPEHPNFEKGPLIFKILPGVPIWKKVFCSPVKLSINNGPVFDIPLTFKDEHVNKLFIDAVPLTFNDDMHVLALLKDLNALSPNICH